MDIVRTTRFRRAALSSGLVSETQLQAALAAAGELSAEGPVAIEDVPDRDLEAALLNQGALNKWQVEQLREGRTKFTLGPYRIIDSLGRGGMGHVFKCEHIMLGRVEAVKVLPKEKGTPEAIEAFQKEIRAQAQLDHENLVRVSFAGQDGETHFFVTEFVDGTDLRRLVREHGRLTMHQAATIISQAAAGLAHAHQRNLVHRDVKPGNILVTEGGRTKVTDLGLSVLLDETGVGTAKIAGTVDYLAPELVRDPSLTAPASDIYSLGCTLYYCVTGKVPYPGGTTSEKLRRHVSQPPITPRRFNPELSDMFLEVLAAMMDKNPATRLASAAEVVDRLRPWTLNSVRLGPGAHADLVEETPSTDGLSQMSQKTGFEDTETGLDVPALAADQAAKTSSQGTLGISAWREETTPISETARGEAVPPGEPIMSPIVMLTVLAAVGILTIVIGAIVVRILDVL